MQAGPLRLFNMMFLWHSLAPRTYVLSHMAAPYMIIES